MAATAAACPASRSAAQVEAVRRSCSTRVTTPAPRDIGERVAGTAAGTREIRELYRQLARRFHPDVAGDDDETTALAGIQLAATHYLESWGDARTVDGTIVGQRLVKSSGNKARDAAVMRGIQATERLPRDTDGRIHTPMLISVRQFG